MHKYHLVRSMFCFVLAYPWCYSDILYVSLVKVKLTAVETRSQKRSKRDGHPFRNQEKLGYLVGNDGGGAYPASNPQLHHP